MKKKQIELRDEIYNSSNWNTAMNFVLLDSFMEHPEGESMTVPGEAFTVRQLIVKHSQGILPKISKTPVYAESEPDFESPAFNINYDLTDLDLNRDTIEQLDKKISQLQENTARKSEPSDAG